MRPRSLKDVVGSPWPYVGLAAAAILIGVAFTPLVAVSLAVGLSVTLVLIWRFGAVRGLWYALILTIPLKEPLSFDVQGTVSFYPTDVLMVLLFVRTVSSVGLRELWRRSASFRLVILIAALSAAGLYTATKFFWGVAILYRIVMLVVFFAIARVVITDRAEALRSLAMVALSLVVPMLVGFHQAAQPFGAELPDWGIIYTAYDAAGNPSHRVFSTLNHPLYFSHYLTIGFAVCLGLAAGLERLWQRVALTATAGVALFCNLYTYSAGGLLGTAATVVVLAVLRRSGKLIAAALVVLIVIALIAPPALVAKVDRLFSGEALTAAARLVTYQQAFMIIRDHPVFGLGWGSTTTHLAGEYRISRADPVAFTAENYFLMRAVALGLVGLGMYVALWLLFIRNTRDLRREWAGRRPVDPVTTAMIAGAVAFIVQAQVIPATNISTNSVLWMMFAAAEALRVPLGGGRRQWSV